MNSKYIIGGIIVLVFIGIAAMNFEKSVTRYVSFAEAKVSRSTVQVKGARVPGSEHFDPESKTFNFKLIGEDGEEFEIIYPDVKPSNFERAVEVVVIGRYQTGQFHAEDVLVKCPSKYEAEVAEGIKS